MKHFTAFALVLTFALPAVSHAAPLDGVPSNDPAWHNADAIQKAGIILGNPKDTNGGNGRRVVTRRAFAAAAAEIMREATGDPVIANRLAVSPPALAALNALVTEFTPELAAMKQNAAQYHSALAALTARHPLVDHPFSDVPANHWAAAAVETLRQRGIVNGYPSSPHP